MVTELQPRDMFVGRDEAIKALIQAMDGVEASKGRAILVSGEAGVGKTTFMGRVAAEAKGRGWAIITGECLLGEGGVPYFPVIKAIQDHLRTRDGPGKGGLGPSEDQQHLPTLPIGLLGMMEGPMDGHVGPARSTARARTTKELGMEKDRMFEKVSRFLSETTRPAPVLFFIDDLHWADTATLQLLFYVIRSSTRERMMVVGTYRPEEIESPFKAHPVNDLLHRLGREDLATLVELRRFDKDETARFLDALAGTELPDDLGKRIHRDTGGNPFFIKEYFEALRKDGALVVGKGITGPLDMGAIEIPSTVSTFIMERVNRLDPEEQRLLQFGAVIGREFGYSVLLASSGMGEERAVACLERLQELKLLVERDLGTDISYRFTHDLICEVLYSHLSRSRRRLIHKKIGESLELLFKDRTEQVVYPLEYHFSRTSDMGRAFKYATMAGRMSYKALALNEAATYLEKALDLLLRIEKVEDMERKEVELLTLLGEVFYLLGNWKKAFQYLDEALELGDEGTVEMGRALRAKAEVEMSRGDFDAALRSLNKAIAISKDTNDPNGLAESARGLAWIHVEKGELDKAAHYANQCITEAKRLKDTYLEGKACIDLGNVYNSLAEFDRALEQYERALTVLDPTKDLDQVGRAQNNIGDVYMKTGEFERAIVCFENCLEVMKVTGEMVQYAYGISNIGECHIRMGEHAKGEAFIDEAIALFDRMDNMLGLVMTRTFKAQILRETGRLDESEAYFTAVIETERAHDLRLPMAVSTSEYGILLKRLGRKEEALENLRTSLKILEGSKRRLRAKLVMKEIEEIEGDLGQG